MNTDWKALCAELVHGWTEGRDIAGPMANARTALDQPEPEGPTDEGLIQRLLSLAEQAVKEALDFEYEDPEDRYIWRELQNLKQLVKEANGTT
jgi:hypothetical protein